MFLNFRRLSETINQYLVAVWKVVPTPNIGTQIFTVLLHNAFEKATFLCGLVIRLHGGFSASKVSGEIITKVGNMLIDILNILYGWWFQSL